MVFSTSSVELILSSILIEEGPCRTKIFHCAGTEGGSRFRTLVFLRKLGDMVNSVRLPRGSLSRDESDCQLGLNSGPKGWARGVGPKGQWKTVDNQRVVRQVAAKRLAASCCCCD